MTVTKLNLKYAKVGEVREFLKNFPDDMEIDLWGHGDGIVGTVELVHEHYEYDISDDLSLEIEAKNSIL